VAYQELHGTDERIEIGTIPAVQAIYQEAVLALLNGQVGSRSPGDW
jgi:hypothetical protein